MKVKVKGLVFAGLAAVIFAGNAMAAVDTTPQAGDLDNTTNLNYVTSKKYVDRVVTNAKADTTALAGRVSEAEADIDDLETNAEMTSNKADNLADVINASDLANMYPNVGAVKNALADKQDVISDLDTIRSGAAAGATAVQPSGLATINSNIQSLQMNKQNKDDSTVADGTYNIITQGSGVGANLQALDSKIGAVPANSTVMAEIAAAQSAATYDDTALVGRVTTAEGNIATLQSGKEDKTNKTTTGLVTDDGNGNITAIAAGSETEYASTSAISSDFTKFNTAVSGSLNRRYTKNETDGLLNNKQDKSDSNVTTAGTYIQTGTGVAANLGRLDTQVKINADAISRIEDYSQTNASNITVLQDVKEDKTNKTTTGLITTDNDGNITAVAAGSATAYASTSAISSDLTKVKNAITAANGVASGLDTRLTTAEGEIDALQAADTTLQNNIDGKQNLSTADYQMGKQGGGWTTMSAAQQNALNSGIVASTCDTNAPCAWINNAWVPIQQ